MIGQLLDDPRLFQALAVVALIIALLGLIWAEDPRGRWK